MHFISMIMLDVPAMTATVTERATRPKANEYKSGDCSGAINYSHNSFFLKDVTMDDSSHSVYLTSTWQLVDGKTGSGGSFSGLDLVTVSYPRGACISLSAESWHDNRLVHCVRNAS
ncbi:hypothetical protein F5Y16DRAFT_228855 [Xylariaceae sp. FL0255]|nr:hypothetical protein F5Y16DRAFT_228855 [Xylariaceae sp. FL0255]